jgi:uncharacterized protein (TIGR02145 family)
MKIKTLLKLSLWLFFLGNITLSKAQQIKSENKPAETIRDIDGNIYSTVKIGSHVWMGQNLKVSHYNDGKSIDLILDSLIWPKSKVGAFCFYQNDTSYQRVLGNLYNYFAVQSGKLCPSNWHVATDENWQDLGNALGSKFDNKKDEDYGVFPNVAHKLRAVETWKVYVDSTNSTRFTALGAGERGLIGEYKDFGKETTWWTSSGPAELIGLSAYTYYLNVSNDLGRAFGVYNVGYSVRCVKD